MKKIVLALLLSLFATPAYAALSGTAYNCNHTYLGVDCGADYVVLHSSGSGYSCASETEINAWDSHCTTAMPGGAGGTGLSCLSQRDGQAATQPYQCYCTTPAGYSTTTWQCSTCGSGYHMLTVDGVAACYDNECIRYDVDEDTISTACESGVAGDGDMYRIFANELATWDNAPAATFYDTDGTDADTNAQIVVNLTATGTGAENADVTMSHQVGGAMTAFLTSDADDDTTLASTDDIVLSPVGHMVELLDSDPVLRIHDSDNANDYADFIVDGSELALEFGQAGIDFLINANRLDIDIEFGTDDTLQFLTIDSGTDTLTVDPKSGGKLYLDGTTSRATTAELLDIDATINTTTATDDVPVVTITATRDSGDTGGTHGIDSTLTFGNMANGEWSYNYGGSYNTSASSTDTGNAAVFYAAAPTADANVNDYGIYITEGYDLAALLDGTVSIGAWGYTGEHVVLPETSSNTNAGLGVYSQVDYSATAGKVFAGAYNRLVALTTNQTNLSTMVGSESQFRLRDVNLANGVHAGLWAYSEQSGTSVLSGGGTFDAINATVESEAGFSAGATEHITGITLDSSINASATINAAANFSAIYIKSNGKDWYDGINITGVANDISLQNGETIDNASDGKITLTGVGGTNNENIIFDLETVADTIGVGTSTGVTTWDFGSIAINTTGSVGTGNLTMESSQPTLTFDDTDSASEVSDATIYANATDTGAGTEDVDVALTQQVASTATTFLSSDADGDLTIGHVGQQLIHETDSPGTGAGVFLDAMKLTMKGNAGDDADAILAGLEIVYDANGSPVTSLPGLLFSGDDVSDIIALNNTLDLYAMTTTESSDGNDIKIWAADAVTLGNGGNVYAKAGDGAGAGKIGGSWYLTPGSGELDDGAIYLAWDPVGESRKGEVGIGTNVAPHLLSVHKAENDGNPVIGLGASDSEELNIEAVYDSGAQTLDYVKFSTQVASASADQGEYIFNVDEVDILTIDDGGIEMEAGMGINVVNNITEFSTDGTMGDNSDLALPTEKAVVTYVGSAVSAIDFWTRDEINGELYPKTITDQLGIGTADPEGMIHVVETDYADLPIFSRSDAETSTVKTALKIVHQTTGSPVTDGMGSLVNFEWQDSSGTRYALVSIGGLRAGADNTGDFVILPMTNGANHPRALFTHDGHFQFGPYNDVDGVDPTATFEAYSSDGVLTWMEDEGDWYLQDAIGIGTNNAQAFLHLKDQDDINQTNLLVEDSGTDTQEMAAIYAKNNNGTVGLLVPSSYFTGSGGSYNHFADRALIYEGINPSSEAGPSAALSGMDIISRDGDIRLYTGGIATGNERLRISNAGIFLFNRTAQEASEIFGFEGKVHVDGDVVINSDDSFIISTDGSAGVEIAKGVSDNRGVIFANSSNGVELRSNNSDVTLVVDNTDITVEDYLDITHSLDSPAFNLTAHYYPVTTKYDQITTLTTKNGNEPYLEIKVPDGGAVETQTVGLQVYDNKVSFNDHNITNAGDINVDSISADGSTVNYMDVDLFEITQADLEAGSCTANQIRIDTGGATHELCVCTSTNNWDCIDFTTLNGPKD